MTNINLTQFTEAGGCGCKISSKMLSEIIQSVKLKSDANNLLTGNYHNDDAAVIKISKQKALVFTDDFFTPIVDDPFCFGQIAACNALSDIYAMGGTPKVALSILGFPVDKIPTKFIRKVLEGAKNICDIANVSLAGGHSINNPQPIFGLSVIGMINPKYLKLNAHAKNNDLIYLTKPLGTGIYSTALKLNKINATDKSEMINVMSRLNVIGKKIAKLDYVNSMTDVTGFGLMGHLIELSKASQLYAEINFDNIQLLKNIKKYFDDGIVTSGGQRNWESYKSLVEVVDNFKKIILSDPQTNGGLLITVNQQYEKQFESFLKRNDLEQFSKPIGIMKTNATKLTKLIVVK
jgi:selenide, water dikinase